LEYCDESLAELIGEESIRQLSEILLDHVGYIMRLRALEELRQFWAVHTSSSASAPTATHAESTSRLHRAAEFRDSGLHACFAEYAHLESDVIDKLLSQYVRTPKKQVS
jgi:hypothetical protein